jgi:hypothetical protein
MRARQGSAEAFSRLMTSEVRSENPFGLFEPVSDQLSRVFRER